MELKDLVKEYLQQGKMLQIATLNGDQPWASIVYFVSDEEMNLYWISLPDTRHSKELMEHSKVAGAIPITYLPEKSVAGVQLEGMASEVKDKDEVSRIIRLYTDKYNRGEDWYKDYLAGRNPHKLYTIRPSYFAVYDSVNFPDAPRQEWRL